MPGRARRDDGKNLGVVSLLLPWFLTSGGDFPVFGIYFRLSAPKVIGPQRPSTLSFAAR